MGLRSQKGAENPTTKCYGEAFVGILVFLKGIIPHIIELKQSKCRVGYGDVVLASEKAGRGRGPGTGEGGFLLRSLASPSPEARHTK